MFDYVLARSRTRESSTLTIATVAASASLVLLVLFTQAKVGMCATCEQELASAYTFVIVYFGMVFSITGILYREVTKYTVHSNDKKWLEACAKQCSKECMNLTDKKGNPITNPLDYCDCSKVREGILRALLVIPIIAWSLLLYHDYRDSTWSLVLLLMISIASTVYIVVASWRDDD